MTSIKNHQQKLISIPRVVKSLVPLLILFVFNNCKNKIDTEVFIFPNNYKGVAIIFLGIETGEEDKIIDNKIIYEFPSTGVLFMRGHLKNADMGNSEYYYKDSNENLTPILKFTDSKDLIGNKIIADNTAGNNSFGEYHSYNYIVISDDNQNHFSGFVLNKYVDSLIKTFRK